MDDYIGGYVKRTKRNGEILEKAGLDINSNGVLIYSTKPGTVGAKLNVLSDKISLVVSSDGKIKPASIVAAINNGSSSIKISADHIILDGEAVADSLDGEEIMCGSLDCKRGSISAFTCDNSFLFEGSSFVLDSPTALSFKGHSVSWQTATITTYNLSETHAFMYKSGNNTPTVLGKLVTSTGTTTIHYMGY